MKRSALAVDDFCPKWLAALVFIALTVPGAKVTP